jgi:hypothetical protein
MKVFGRLLFAITPASGIPIPSHEQAADEFWAILEDCSWTIDQMRNH